MPAHIARENRKPEHVALATRGRADGTYERSELVTVADSPPLPHFLHYERSKDTKHGAAENVRRVMHSTGDACEPDEEAYDEDHMRHALVHVEQAGGEREYEYGVPRGE